MDNLLFGLAAGLYAAATVLHVLYLLHLRGRLGRGAWLLGALALGVLALGLAGVTMTDGVEAVFARRYLPAVSAFVLGLAATLLGIRSRFFVTGTFVSAVDATVLVLTVAGCGALPLGGRVSAGLGAMSPIHITASTLGFLAFVLADVAAALYVLQDARLRTKANTAGQFRLPSLQSLEQAMYRILFVGFVLYTIGAVLGTILALRGESSAGFKPQYPLAILSWGVFAIVLGLRAVTGWSGRRAAMLVALGFVANLAVVLCYYFRFA